MIKLFLIAVLFSIAGCTGEDKKTATENIVTPVMNNGETLFKANCASCHRPDKDFTGPALQGSLQRWGGDKKVMYEFIRNPAKSIVENTYAKQLFEKWNSMMTSFDLPDAELDSIMNFCEKYNSGPVPGTVVD